MENPLLPIDKLLLTPWDLWDLLVVSMAVIVFLAMILRYFPGVPEPDLRFKTPFGKVPFFDGVVLYGLAAIFFLCTVELIKSFF